MSRDRDLTAFPGDPDLTVFPGDPDRTRAPGTLTAREARDPALPDRFPR